MLGSVYALVAVAFTFTIGILNFLNFSIPGIFMVTGMATWAMLKAGVALPIVVVLGLALGAALSFLVERFIFRASTHSDHYVPLVGSMAFLILFENLVLIRWGSDLQRLELPFADTSMRIAGLVIGIPQVIGLLLAVGAVWALAAIMRRTRLGRGLRTIAENPETATLLGVRVGRVVPTVFIIGGVFTALAGLLFAVNYQQVSPFMGEEVALKGISAMVIGGMGNIWGAILGGLVIGVVETAAITWFGARAVDIGVYGLLLLILFFRPTGLLGGHAGERA
ncbi:MAG: branched-chain amino acid ABC transporter permease [Betaproteobacteria bacterium]|nr:branched-chain amino acid ABC transporter permease [Betaproteobacteria bacterium]